MQIKPSILTHTSRTKYHNFEFSHVVVVYIVFVWLKKLIETFFFLCFLMFKQQNFLKLSLLSNYNYYFSPSFIVRIFCCWAKKYVCAIFVLYECFYVFCCFSINWLNLYNLSRAKRLMDCCWKYRTRDERIVFNNWNN